MLDEFSGLQLPELSKNWSVVCDAVSSGGDFWVGEGIGAAPELGVCLGHRAGAQDVCPELCPALDTH